MANEAYELFESSQITDNMLQEAANLFSSHYGVWGPKAVAHLGPFAKAGRHVKVTKDRLRKDYLSGEGGEYLYARVLLNNLPIGHAIATRYPLNVLTTCCWISQLVIHTAHRKRGLATKLLRTLKDPPTTIYQPTIYGILSSHPAACMAAARAFSGGSIYDVPLNFIATKAGGVMELCPIPYVKNAELRARCYSTEDGDSGVVCCADTNFWVDHEEPRRVLGEVERKHGGWPLGRLEEGCEFVVLVESNDSTDERIHDG